MNSLAPNVEILVPGPYELAESPTFVQDRLHFVDLLKGRVWRVDVTAAAPAAELVVELPVPVGALLPVPDGTTRVVHGLAVSVLRAGQLTDTVTLPGDPTTHRVNDAIVDIRGRTWVGVMPYEDARTGCLYLVDGTRVTRVRDGLGIPNGFGLSPDGTLLYHVESVEREITVFDSTPQGDPHRQASFTVPGPGLPDGMTVDDEGCLWVAIWDASRVLRLSPTGELLADLPLPCRRPTSCALHDGDLYITSARLGLGQDGTDADGAVLVARSVR